MTRSSRVARLAGLSLVFALCLPAMSADVPAAETVAADPIEGKWLGEIGFPTDRVAFGIEFKRNEKNELRATIYQPVVNFYGLSLPGTFERDGNRYTCSSPTFEITRNGDTLEGTMTSLKEPLSLSRTDSLPSDPPIPDLPKGPGPKWQTKLGAPIYAPVAAKDGIAYVGTTGGVFQALHSGDGSFVWTFSAGRPIHGGALISSNAVYFVCDNGFLFRLDHETGKEVWRYDLGDARVDRVLPHQTVFEYDYRAPTPLLSDGTIFVGAADGGFHAVNCETGQRVWRFEAKGKIRSSATVSGPNVVFGTMGNVLYAVDRAKGVEVWNKDLRAPITSSPVLSDGRILVGNRGSILYALDPTDAKVLWRQLFWGSWVESTAVPFGDRLYIGSSDLRRVACYEPSDGRVLWRTDVLGCPWGTPAVTDKHVYSGALGSDPYMTRHVGGFVCLDRTSGKIQWRWPVGESASLQTGFAGGPALDGDTIIIGGLDGVLYAFPAE